MKDLKKNWTVGRGIAVAGKWLAIMGMVIALLTFTFNVMKLQRGYYDRDYGIKPAPERPEDLTQLQSLLVEEIDQSNLTDGNCLDYATHYNETLTKNYPELDVRWPRYVDLCNNLTLCDSYHTYLVVNGYGEECILDQKSMACIQLRDYADST